MTRLWILAVLTCVVVVACEKVPLTSPTGSTISVSIDRNVLPLNGQATVRAVVSEVSGTPVHNGTMVTFNPSIGRTDPVEAPSVNGIATATYLAGSISGSGVIHAFSGGARTGSGNSSAGGVEVKIGTAGAERIAVRSEPTNIPITGGSVVVVAALFDASGNPITNTSLAFSTDFGTLSSNSATTDANGEARVSLTTNRTTTVTVTAGSKTQAFTLNALNPPSVTLACTGSPNATVGVPVSCTVTTAASGNSSSSAPIQNVTINWGDGTGEQPLGPLTGASTVSHTYTTPGSFTVTAAATDQNSQRGSSLITLNVTRSIPTISIAGPATGNVGVPVSFTVTPPSGSAGVPTSNVTVDFGDGTTRNLGAITAATTVSKTYGAEGNYTASATVTDTAGGRNTSTTAILISRGTATSATLTQNGTISGGVGSFTVGATAGTGTTIQSIVVRKPNGDIVYQGSSGATFAARGLNVNDILTATATDSSGATATAQVVVR